MFAEARVRRLIHGEVLRLDQDEVAQERCEEDRDEHADNQREVEHDLGNERVWLDYKWEETCRLGCLQGLLSDENVNICRQETIVRFNLERMR